MSKNTITWIFSQNRWADFGFVDVKEEWVWYYVFPLNRKDALDWDEVLAEVKVFKWKKEAVIIKVIKRADNILVWEFMMWKTGKYWFINLKSQTFKKDVFIAWKYIWNAVSWSIVWIKILSREWKNPEWKIVEILWNKEDKDIDVKWFILEAWFSEWYTDKIENDLKKINLEISKSELSRRKDFRKMFTFTIDSKDAKDLDDAISIIKKENWDYRLFVHIADVSHYVKEGGLLNKEALKKSTSVYLTDRTLPMLPRKLSNNLCSLNPDSDKLTLSVEMIIWKSWELKKTIMYESIIRSDYRLTYKEVDELLSWESSELFCQKKITPKLLNTLKMSEELKNIISKNKEIAWVLNFDFPETKVILDDDKNVIEIKEYQRYNSNKIIAEFMIMANYAVSKKFSTFPFLYRIHEDPNSEDIFKLQTTLDILWINFKVKKISTKEFASLLKIIETSDKKQILEKVILRTLSKAIYSPDNKWHFWLGINFYSHFTSPIRRYPDLQIHRIIKDKLNWKLDKGRIIHYRTILKQVADHCSENERKAEKLEYKVRDYYIVKYYKDKVWQEFQAIITSIIKNGFFVSLPDSSEWFVEMPNSESFEDTMQLRDLQTWNKYSIWDNVTVKLIEADQIRIRLNFAIT